MLCGPCPLHGGRGNVDPLWGATEKMLPEMKAGVLSRTLSQKWGSWNLPMFLSRDGSLTLMYMVSLKAQNYYNKHSTSNNSNNSRNIYMVVPYTKGVRKSVRMFAVSWGSRSISKEATPSRPSRWTSSTGIISLKSGVIYRCKCDQGDHKEEYIKVSARTYGES